METPLKQPIVFELEGFHVSPGYGSLLFLVVLVTCIVTLLGNGVVACVIIIDKSLHRPMFIMVCNLVACDLLGAVSVLPHLMMHFLTGEKKVAYVAAIAQALGVHTYGAAVHTVLGAMAYDRYPHTPAHRDNYIQVLILVSHINVTNIILLFQNSQLTGHVLVFVAVLCLGL